MKPKAGGAISQGPSGNSSNEGSKKKNQPMNVQKENIANQNQQANPMYQQPNQNLRPTSSKNILIFIFDAMTNQPIPNVNVQVNRFILNYIYLYLIFAIQIMKYFLLLNSFCKNNI